MPDLMQAGLEWFRGLVAREGLLDGCVSAVRQFAELALDCLPSRRRLRYGDIDYDWDHRVETTWANPSMSVRLQEIFTRGKYQPSEPQLFHEILHRVSECHQDFVFIDLGSGKGRTLLMASDYPFRGIIGVEIIPELHEIALQNVACYRNPEQRCSAILPLQGDARNFQFPDQPLLIYLFNPFPEDILRQVLANLERSLRACPRPCKVVYHNLVHEDVFTSMGFLQWTDGSSQFAIYEVHLETGRC